MFEYEIDGKKAVLVLRDEFVEKLKPLGVDGPIVYGTVLRADRGGLWMDNPSFPLCPTDQPRLYTPKDSAFCRAHVFIPEDAVLSVAVFPKPTAPMERPEVKPIGFAFGPKLRGR